MIALVVFKHFLVRGVLEPVLLVSPEAVQRQHLVSDLNTGLLVAHLKQKVAAFVEAGVHALIFLVTI